MALPGIYNQPKIYPDNSKQSSSIKRVGLMGPFGGGNLGDAAIQTSMIANLHRLNPKIEIYGFSINPQDTKLRHNIPAYPINKAANSLDYLWWKGTESTSFAAKLTQILKQRKQKSNNSLSQKIILKLITGTLEFLACLRAYQNLKRLRLDLFIVSGGGQLDDYWGGAWNHPFTLLRWCLLSKMAGIKFLIVSVGAAPINQPLSKLFTRITLSLADYRSYRDLNSKQYIAQVIGFQRNDPVYADLAYSLPIEAYQASPKQTNCPGIIGIAPMSYFHPQSSWPEKNQAVYRKYLEQLGDFAIWLTQQNYTLALFPGQTAHDKFALEDFKQLLQQHNIPEEQIIHRPILTVDDLMNQLVDLDSVIASRFHGVLLSLLLNKPTIALAYHSKIDMLMANSEQSEYCLAIDNFNVELIKEKFNLLNHHHQAIAAQLASKTQEYKSSLAAQYEYIFKHF